VSNAGAIGAGESAIPVLAADHHVVEGAELVAFITRKSPFQPLNPPIPAIPATGVRVFDG